MNKPLLERVMAYKKFVRQFQKLQTNNLKIQILKNQMIHYLEIIETKKYIYMTK